MSIEQKRRELFEARERDMDRIISEKYCGQYTSDRQQDSWLDWNAALDAVEIELPHDVSHVTCKPFEEGRDAVLTAIESTGLGLKVKP